MPNLNWKRHKVTSMFLRYHWWDSFQRRQERITVTNSDAGIILNIQITGGSWHKVPVRFSVVFSDYNIVGGKIPTENYKSMYDVEGTLCFYLWLCFQQDLESGSQLILLEGPESQHLVSLLPNWKWLLFLRICDRISPLKQFWIWNNNNNNNNKKPSLSDVASWDPLNPHILDWNTSCSHTGRGNEEKTTDSPENARDCAAHWPSSASWKLPSTPPQYSAPPLRRHQVAGKPPESPPGLGAEPAGYPALALCPHSEELGPQEQGSLSSSEAPWIRKA